ncbi:MAG: hypothetical protein DHS20C17_27170 [Cyclobacteriaceae bacterium]|nr:MAG: hypothetical protein DHS20C17_27170 [Cyclobacteriaceae bacterium]
MTISRLLFPQDKNYILKEVQADTRTQLLGHLVTTVRETYLNRFNPLGLEDDTILKIKACKTISIDNLENFYWELAGIFRYKVGSNQLEFIFSGKSHYQKYYDDWNEAFHIWLEDFTFSPYFIRAVLEMCILQPHGRPAELAKGRMKVYLSQYFNLKVYKYRGITPIKAA